MDVNLEFKFPLGDIKDLSIRSEDRYYVEVNNDPTRLGQGAQRDKLTGICFTDIYTKMQQ